jgi:hypothetical protein
MALLSLAKKVCEGKAGLGCVFSGAENAAKGTDSRTHEGPAGGCSRRDSLFGFTYYQFGALSNFSSDDN